MQLKEVVILSVGWLGEERDRAGRTGENENRETGEKERERKSRNTHTHSSFSHSTIRTGCDKKKEDTRALPHLSSSSFQLCLFPPFTAKKTAPIHKNIQKEREKKRKEKNENES